jgi:hypothetical protein
MHLPRELWEYILKIKKFTFKETQKKVIMDNLLVKYADCSFLIGTVAEDGIVASFLFDTKYWFFIVSHFYDEEGDLIDTHLSREIKNVYGL